MNKFPGHRVHFENDGKNIPMDIESRLKPGDYWRFEPHNLWLVCAPNGDLGSIRSGTWMIVEHEDGTITVSPSIQFYTKDVVATNGWHGYLTHGIWVEA